MSIVVCLCVLCTCCVVLLWFFFFFKQKTAYEMRISDWSSDVCSSDLLAQPVAVARRARGMILGAVAFDPEQEAAGLFGIRYREIDPKARGADLALHVIA